ncbi:hypothetical protein CVT25_004814 [Psilocybe cyanescens]|uniref:DUF6534 domain-containing protein n=1 Tax=Psilocybe cyanescens TaxID=93625 RepID=A0A409XGL3_PSICY|nr:hypothetical protein CVT25_004814 [Psilocybe cyanescens]
MVNVTLSFGPMLIGVFFNMILYGVLLVQTYHYYITFKRDAPWIKYLVLYLFILESVNTGCDMAMMYQPLIQNFGSYLPVYRKRRSFSLHSKRTSQVAISTPIQIFFAWRIKLLTKSNVLAIVVVVLSLVSLGGGTYTTVLLVKIKLFSRKPELHWPALVWLLSASVADILITTVLVLTLSKRRTGFIATDDAISKIIRMTVQTGMLTAFFAIGDVIFFMSLPHTALNFLWDLSLSKLYTNCLLSTLNAREELQELAQYSSHRRNVVSTTAGRRQDTQMEAPAHIFTSAMYELDNQKSSHTQSGDMEYGITITKVR